MTLIHLGFGLMTAAAITLWILNRRLSRQLRSAVNDSRMLSEMLQDLMTYKTGTDLNHMLRAYVEEQAHPMPHFSVCRRIDRHHRLCLMKIDYNPADPDDREYKRIFAEERAEMLNEKP